MMKKDNFSIERGFHVKSRSRNMECWNNLFEEWLLCTERYCRIEKGDASYWHNERANIGILSASAWRCGWITLEEYDNEKYGDKKSKNGRPDLWIRFDKNNEIIIEAKWLLLEKYLSLDYTNKVKNSIENKLKEACNGVRKYEIDKEERIGMVFCCPKIDKECADNIEEKIEETMSISKQIEQDAMAWCFPLNTRELDHYDKGKEKEFIFLR